MKRIPWVITVVAVGVVVVALVCLIGLGQFGLTAEDKPDKPKDTTKLLKEITPEIQKAIEKGVEWLLSAQNTDGSWGHDIKTPPEIGITSVVCMAFMANGTTPKGTYPSKVLEPFKKGIHYIIKFVRERRAMFEEPSVLEGEVGRTIHFYLTSLFLSQVQGEDILTEGEHESIREIIKKINLRIDIEQDKEGFWHDQNLFLSSATAWLALRSAHAAGLAIHHASVDKTVQYLKKVYSPATGNFGEQSYRPSVVLGSALRVLYGYGLADSDEAKGAAATLLKIGFKENNQEVSLGAEHYLAAAYATQAFRHREDDKNWEEWYSYVSKYLVKIQNADGSWTGSRCISARTFCTACAILTLLTPYRVLPMLEF